MDKTWVFVVASHRSGTNMLLQALNTIHNTQNIGEIIQVTFGNKVERKIVTQWRTPVLDKVFGIYDFPHYIKPQWLPWVWVPDQWCVKQFIQSLLYGEHYTEEGILASYHHTFYCKLLFQQCPPSYHLVWDWLYKQPVKIIYLRRKNLFDICVSAQNAVQTGQWYLDSKSKEKPQHQKFHIRIDDLHHKFSFLRMCEDFFMILSRKSHKAIIVDYDNLVNNWDNEIQRILAHIDIDIPSENVKQVSKRHITDHKSLVTNYDELKQYFRHTTYEECFL